MKVITIALAVFVPIYIHTHNGLRTIEGSYAELAETLGCRRSEFVRHVVLPGAMPGFLLGLRFAVTSSLLALVVVEVINATSGIGHMITLASNYGQTDIIVVGLVVYALLGVAADAVVRLIERKALSWRRTLAELSTRPETRGAGRRPCTAASTRRVACSTASTSTSRPESSWPCSGAAARARAPCSGPWPAWTAAWPAPVSSRSPRRCRSSSRTPGCCRGSASSTTSRSACRAGDASDRGRQALAEVGLAGREKAWPHELSGGEQQRASLARSLVRDPQLLLADEPFGALDALTRIRMHTLLRKLCEVHQPAVLLVTHDVDEAIVLADRVIVLDGGVVSPRHARRARRPPLAGRPGVRPAARAAAHRARRRGRPRRRTGTPPRPPPRPASERAAS